MSNPLLNRTRQLPVKNTKEQDNRMRGVRNSHPTVVSSLLCFLMFLSFVQNAVANIRRVEEEIDIYDNSNSTDFDDEEIQIVDNLPPIEQSECVETGPDLLQAVKHFYQWGTAEEYETFAARRYGWPIESWCISSEVETRLNADESVLLSRLHELLEELELEGDEGFIGEDDLVGSWLGAVSTDTCLDLCSITSSTLYPSSTSTSMGTGSSTVQDKVNNNIHFDDNTKSLDLENEESIDIAIVNGYNNDMDFDDQVKPVQYVPDASNLEEETIHRNKTTTGMLFRLIPVKLVAILSVMCLVLWLRQLFLNSDQDSCCGKIGAKLGFGNSSHQYQGIDPSDLAHDKSVDFEMLQLAASGDPEEDDIEIF